MLANLGLLAIIGGWVIQLLSINKKKNQVQPSFVAVYGLGVLLLVVDGFQSGLTNLAVLNLISLIIATLVLYRIIK